MQTFPLELDNNLNIRNHNNKIIVPKELKLKNIQKEIRKPITPKSFIIQSIKYSLIINKGIIVFVPYIVYFKYIISQKRLKKKWISTIQAWNNFLGSCSTESKNNILDKNIFGNSEIKFNRNPLFSIILYINFMFTFDKIVYVNHSHPPFINIQATYVSFYLVWFIVPETTQIN
jgi:hypothetical protein